MKKLKILPLFLLSMSLSSCFLGTYIMESGSIEQSDNEISGNYVDLQGNIKRKFELESEELHFLFIVKSDKGNKGNLSLTVSKDNEVEKQYVNLSAAYLVFTLESGDYLIKIQAMHHSGSFSLTWE